MNAETRQEQWGLAIAQAEGKFNEIAAADGNLVTFLREAMFAHQAIAASSYLQKCTPDSVFNAVINIASVGLTLSPAEKLAYLVPRFSKEAKATLCCLDMSYRGLKKIAEDSGGIKTAVAELVYTQDAFKWVDKFSKPLHEYDPFAPVEHRGDVRGAYCMAILADGTIQCEPMSLEEIEKVQNFSEAKNGPWKTWWGEQAKKTVVRRASKMWPHSSRMQVANSILDAHQGLANLPALEAPATAPADLMPRQKGEAPTPQAAAPAPQSKTPSQSAPDGLIGMIKRKIAAANKTEADVCARFKVEKLDGIALNVGNDILAWLRDPKD